MARKKKTKLQAEYQREWKRYLERHRYAIKRGFVLPKIEKTKTPTRENIKELKSFYLKNIKQKETIDFVNPLTGEIVTTTPTEAMNWQRQFKQFQDDYTPPIKDYDRQPATIKYYDAVIQHFMTEVLQYGEQEGSTLIRYFIETAIRNSGSEAVAKGILDAQAEYLEFTRMEAYNKTVALEYIDRLSDYFDISESEMGAIYDEWGAYEDAEEP